MQYPGVSVLTVLFFALALPDHGFAKDKITAIQVNPARSLVMEYDGYWSGLRVVTAVGEASFTEESYSVSVAARTRGFIKLFVNGKSLAQAEGSITRDGAILPGYYSNDGVWNEKRYARTLTFFPDGSLDEFEFIRPEDEDAMEWEPVPEILRRGPDPLSLIFHASRDPWGVAASQKTEKGPAIRTSFDGIRTVEYQIACNPEEQVLKKSGRGIYYGPAILCEIHTRQTAGFYIEKDEKKKRKEEKRRLKEAENQKPVKLWLGAIEGTPWYVPVRLEMRGNGRNLKAYLTRIENKDTVTEANATP